MNVCVGDGGTIAAGAEIATDGAIPVELTIQVAGELVERGLARGVAWRDREPPLALVGNGDLVRPGGADGVDDVGRIANVL